MKRLVLVLAAAVLLSPAHALADVTFTMSVSMGNPTIAVASTMVTSIKASQMRVDLKSTAQEMTLLVDAASRQAWMINRQTKQVEPYSPEQLAGRLPVDLGEPKISVSPNGKSKDVQGRNCQGYDLEMSLPMTVAGESVVTRITGTMWMAKDGPGIAELQAAQQPFSEMGMALSPFGQGPQGKALLEAGKAATSAGVMLEQEITIALEGTGQAAEMLARAGGMRMTASMTSLSTDPIPAEMFSLPEGYVKK